MPGERVVPAARVVPGETIVACATPFGTSAIAVVRVSGPEASAVVQAVAGRVPAPRRASLRPLRDGHGVFDEGVVTWFPGPRSYTGEDLAELSCHGNPLLVARLTRACLAAGARTASPGEFTRRALLYGRLDLVRAEAVLATLTATSEAGLARARVGVEGHATAAVEHLRAALVDTAAELEAILDYPGEDLLFSADEALDESLAAVGREAGALLARSRGSRLAVEGARVALVGPVNAGKSTLLNALVGRERVLTSPSPGTTRDAVEVSVALPQARVVFVDTAGERETEDPVEAAGLVLGRKAAAEADLRLFVYPLHEAWRPGWGALLAGLAPPVLKVGTHLDLRRTPRGFPGTPGADSPVADLEVAAPLGVGVEAVLDRVVEALGGGELDGPGAGGPALFAARQVELLTRFVAHLDAARSAFSAGPAVVVEELYEALRQLDDLLGRDTREDVLDRLFARFCVGK